MNRQGGIGSLRETSLHAALKDRFTRPGDVQETPVDGYVIDIVRGEQLIEIQTRNFSALKPKLANLLERHPITIIHPVALEKWIVRSQSLEGEPLSRRRSPRRGRLEDVFYELVRIPSLLLHPNLSLIVLMVREEDLRVNDGRGSWRRAGWSIADRRLLEIVESYAFDRPADYLRCLPAALAEPFTAAGLADSARINPTLARRMLYCLRHMGLIELIGKQAQAHLYRRISSD